MKNIGFLFVLSCIFSNAAKANWLVEPYLGYEVGSWKYTSGGINYSSNTSNMSGGLRLGYSFTKFFLALDYVTTQSGSVKYGDPTGVVDETFSSNMAFFDAGIDVNPKFRTWVGYAFYNKMTNTAGNPPFSTYFSGAGYKIGFGYRIWNHVALNLEYTVPTFDQVDDGTGGGFKSLSTIYSSMDMSRTGVSFSFPIP